MAGKTLGDIEKEFDAKFTMDGVLVFGTTVDVKSFIRHAIAEAFEATRVRALEGTDRYGEQYSGAKKHETDVAAAQKKFLSAKGGQ